MASKLEKVDELIFGIFAKKTDKQCLTYYVSNIANNIPYVCMALYKCRYNNTRCNSYYVVSR